MKISILLLLLLVSLQVFAQQLHGIVMSRDTALPVVNAKVTIGTSTALTSPAGTFSFTNAHPGDTLKVSSVGFKTYQSILEKGISVLYIYLEQNSILLKDVTIKGILDRSIDSIRNRDEFAEVFTYKQKTLMDAFVKKKVVLENPFAAATPPTTSSIISIDVLLLIKLLNKSDAPVSRLKKMILQQEEERYTHQFFSKSKVSAITLLQGDSLLSFMNRYRPARQVAESMNDYNMLLYIQKSYREFLATDSNLLFVKE